MLAQLIPAKRARCKFPLEPNRLKVPRGQVGASRSAAQRSGRSEPRHHVHSPERRGGSGSGSASIGSATSGSATTDPRDQQPSTPSSGSCREAHSSPLPSHCPRSAEPASAGLSTAVVLLRPIPLPRPPESVRHGAAGTDRHTRSVLRRRSAQLISDLPQPRSPYVPAGGVGFTGSGRGGTGVETTMEVTVCP